MRQLGLCSDGLLRPHPPPPSPKEGERYRISFLIFITTTSSLYLYSTLSNTLMIIGVFEKRGLRAGGLLFWRRSGGGRPGLYFFILSTAFLIIRFTSTATIARLYSSLPRKSADGLQSSEAKCAASAIFSSVN